jgi:hypothetical protein
MSEHAALCIAAVSAAGALGALAWSIHFARRHRRLGTVLAGLAAAGAGIGAFWFWRYYTLLRDLNGLDLPSFIAH